MAKKTTEDKCNQRSTDQELEATVDRFSRSEMRSAIVLVGALLAESATVWFFADKQDWHTVVLAAINVVVALSVSAEFVYAHWADGAKDELISRSKERAANAEKEAARLRERTAQIEKLTAWRRLSDEQCELAANAVRNLADGIDVLIEWQHGDAESWSYAQDIVRVFLSAGVKGDNVRGMGNSYFHPAFGLFVSFSSELRTSGEILNAFTKARIPFTGMTKDLSIHLARNERAPNLYIFIGPKPPPGLE